MIVKTFPRYFSGLTGLLLLAACTSSGPAEKPATAYFSIKAYFEKEAARLNRQQPEVIKTVSINGVEEKKSVKISDFKKELANFSDADINKSSWRGAFKIGQKDSVLCYSTDNEKIPVKRVEIYKDGAYVKRIRIIRLKTNILYRAADTLIYSADRMYEIRKTEKVKLLAPAIYSIKGQFLFR